MLCSLMPRFNGSNALTGPITLVYFNAGGGHRAAAHALKSQLNAQNPPWDVRLVDLFEVLDPEHRFKRMTGFAPESYYNKRLSTGFTLGLKHELKVLQAMIRMAHPQLVHCLVGYWHQIQPAMVVSLVPNFNRAIGASLQRYRPRNVSMNASTFVPPDTAVPYVTVMTDMADYPPHFWVEPGYTEHVVCGTEYACAQAIAQGIATDRIHRVSGMMLSPRFYASVRNDSASDSARDSASEMAGKRQQARQALGFDPDQAVGCVMFGGHGSSAMRRIATMLSDRPMILLCGRNEALQRSLKRLTAKAPHVVVGFTDDVAHWMQLSDYFIGKPGPGSISEALHCGLPVIVTRNAWTMPQERFNTDWVRDQGLGQVVSSTAQIPGAVSEVIANLAPFRKAVAQLRNRALFEVVRTLEDIITPSVCPQSLYAQAGTLE